MGQALTFSVLGSPSLLVMGQAFTLAVLMSPWDVMRYTSITTLIYPPNAAAALGTTLAGIYSAGTYVASSK